MMRLRMQKIIATIWLAFNLIGHACSATTPEPQALSFADYPACSIQCAIPAMPESGCGMADMNCICSNRKLQETIASCLLANCSMADIQTSARVQAALCSLPNDSQRKELTYYTVTTHVLTAVSVLLRLVSKYVARRLSKDDLVLVICYILDIVLLGIRLGLLNMGLGQHVWNLGDGVLLPLLRIWYVGAIFYIAILGILKTCVVLFYLDIFQTAYPRFRLAAYTVLIYIVVNTLVVLFLAIFACHPIETFWNRDIKGKCLDIPAIGYAVGVSAVVQDIILIILPITVIRSLSMDFARKLSAGLLFSVGAFGCIATILRLQINRYIKVSLDPTWDYSSGLIWVELEVCAIYICISLPSIRILIVRMMPARFKNLFGRMVYRSDDKQQQQQQSPTTPQTSDQQRSPARGFFSRIMPQTSLWSRFTGSLRSGGGGTGGGSRGLFSTGQNESEVAIAQAPADMGEGGAELQEGFQLFRKYWSKEMGGGGSAVLSQV